MAGRPIMTAKKTTEIADAAHELYNLVKQNCPAWYTEPGREFADDDFVARYWRKNLRAAKDMLNEAEQLEGWLYEKAELPVPVRRDERSFEPFWWEPEFAEYGSIIAAVKASLQEIS